MKQLWVKFKNLVLDTKRGIYLKNSVEARETNCRQYSQGYGMSAHPHSLSFLDHNNLLALLLFVYLLYAPISL